MLMTKIPGGSKIISTNKAGKIQEYTNKFTADGFVQVKLFIIRLMFVTKYK